MINHPQERELALYSTRDLDSASLASITHHLTECSECRGHLAEYEHLQNIMASFPAEVTANDLDDVRTAIMGALDNQWNAGRAMKWALAAALGLVASVLIFQSERASVVNNQPAQPPIVAAEHTPDVAPLSTPPIPSVRVARRKQPTHVPGLTSIELITAIGQVPIIKMTTSDPSVIILLPPDSQTNERTTSND